jgi:hypothetical protein
MTAGYFEATRCCAAALESDRSFGAGAGESGAECDTEAEAEAEVRYRVSAELSATSVSRRADCQMRLTRLSVIARVVGSCWW